MIEDRTGAPPYPDAGSEDERRRSARVRTVYRVVRVANREDEGLARLRNISDGGLKLQLRLALQLMDHVEVALSPNMAFGGKVVWLDGDSCGVRFDTPVNSLAALNATAHEARQCSARQPRLRTAMSAAVTSERGLRAVQVTDVSQNGMKLRHDGSFTPGLQVKVSLCSGTERRGVIRWVRDNYAGLALIEPFTVEQLGSVRAL
jgi:hypothetical protein